MTNEEFQKLVLQKLSSLERIENELQEVKNDVRSVKEDMTNLNNDVRSVKENVINLTNKADKILEDQPQDIVAILNVLNSKVSTKEDIARVEDILDVLAARTTRQEAEILNLKRAK